MAQSVVNVNWGRTRKAASFAASGISLTDPAGRGEYWWNCTPTGGGWRWDGWELTEVARDPSSGAEGAEGAAGAAHHKQPCVGPYAFAKGPLKFYSRAAVRWLVEGPRFERDVQHATRLMGQSAGGVGAAARLRRRDATYASADKLSEDAHLGYWFSAHPTLHFVQLRQYGGGQWYDHWQHVSRVRHVLMAHRTPYALFEWLTRQTARLWRGGMPELRVLSQCSDHPPCDPAHCTHGPRTRACALVVELPPPEPGGLDVTCTVNQRRFECACEARNASAVEQLKVPCSFQVSQGADGIAAHAFRKLKWPEDCPAHQPPPQARGVAPL